MNSHQPELTRHAALRMQQRHVHPLVVDLLYRYGCEKQQAGATLLYFDQRSRDKARAALAEALQRFEKLSQVYVVEASDSGELVTIAYRYKRLRND